jgi:NAD(P)-dependent dehydrogenase (short-subunit alcohol dehydrogenase family)
MTNLHQQVVIVTGASRGIGAASARAFAAAGARVVLAARSKDALEALAGEIHKAGGEAMPVATDVADGASVERLVAAAVETYGRLDAAFNNAGAGHAPRPLAEISLEDFDRTVAVIQRGVFLCMKYEIPAMLASGGGAIVNMASTAGLGGAPEMGSYVAAKHGVVGLTRTAAIDYAERGIRVNALAPGPIFTRPEMEAAQVGRWVPMQRMERPDEVAAAAVWLCSDEASYITGVTLPIDGGKVARSA